MLSLNVTSYYLQEKPANGLPESGFDSASFPFQDSFSEDPSSVLPWDRFSSWIHCFAVVTFDLEIGQMIEVQGMPILGSIQER